MVNENDKDKDKQNPKKTKKIPDWLNSSLWSTPPPSTTTATATTTTLHHSQDLSDSTYLRPPSPVPPPQPPQPQPPPPPPPPPPSPPPSSTSTSSSLSPEEISRQAQLFVELSKKVINIREVRRLASLGVPDAPGLRSTVWKLLLGYLPCDRSMWPSELAKKRLQYKHFKDDLLMSPKFRGS